MRKRDDTKEILPITDAIFDTLHRYDVPPGEGLAALAYCLGLAAGVESSRRREDIAMELLHNIINASFTLGKAKGASRK